MIGLDDVSLSIESGEFVFLVGPSGSGKSTFIRLLIKEFDPTEGAITVGGRNLNRLRRSKVPTCGAPSGASSRTSSSWRAGPSTTTWPTRSR